MSQALLLIAHGSRRAESNDEVRRLTSRVAAAAGARFAPVRCAFLELAEPSIADALTALIEQGARDIVVLPYFLAAGRHVVEDIPEQIDGVRRDHPQVRIAMAPYLGQADAIAELLVALAERRDTATEETTT